jgi:hypothetical protein
MEIYAAVCLRNANNVCCDIANPKVAESLRRKQKVSQRVNRYRMDFLTGFVLVSFSLPYVRHFGGGHVLQ